MSLEDSLRKELLDKVPIENVYSKEYRKTAPKGTYIDKGMYHTFEGGINWWGFLNYPHLKQVIWTNRTILDGLILGQIRFQYIPNYDIENFYIETEYGSFVPNPERTIVDAIKYHNSYGCIVREDILLSIQEYFECENTLEDLLKVADFYKVDIKQWLIDAEDFYEKEI